MADVYTVGVAFKATGLGPLNQDMTKVRRTAQQTGVALDGVSREAAQAGNMAATSAKQMGLQARALQRLGISANQAKAGMGQLPLQLQDIMVQLEMGVPLTRTLGQQLPQIAGAFGGIGAAVGLVVGGFISFLPLLIDLGDSAEDTADEINNFEDALKDLRKETAETALEVERLNKGFLSTEEALLDRRLAIIADVRRAKQDRLREGMEQGSRMRGGVRQSLRDQIAELQREEDELRKAMSEYRAQKDAEEAAKERREIMDNAREQRGAGIGSLITGGASAASERYFADTEARVQATRDRIEEEVELEEAKEKQLEKVRKAALAQAKKDREASAREMEKIAQGMTDSFINAFEQMIAGTKSVKDAFKDMASSIISDIARIVIQQQVSKPIGGFLSSALSGLMGAFTGGGNIVGVPNTQGPAPTVMAAANGAAFNGSGLIPFARGGVVNSPTIFPFANGTGLMGEAGPEAIMPLKRGPDGKLGVAGGGGGGRRLTSTSSTRTAETLRRSRTVAISTYIFGRSSRRI